MSYNKVNQTTGKLEQIAGSQVNSVYADAPLGVIMPYGGTTVPTAWLECDGSAVSRTTYADLFAVLGTKFGPGDGSTTFNLPSGDFGAQLYPAFEGMYIIKAVKAAVPVDFEQALEEKQNITDNTLQTTSKTVPGAINEINQILSDISNEFSIENIQNIKFKWDADLQRFEIIATLYPANVLVLIQFNYDNTIKMFQSSDGGSTWQNIWVK
jgi:microcystin-dependent protein